MPPRQVAAIASRPPPHVGGADATWALRRDPYRFISRECRALNVDVAEARLLLRPTLLLTGPPAAALFYDASRFERAGAAPRALRATLFGEGTVQSLDGAAHLRRKGQLIARSAKPRSSGCSPPPTASGPAPPSAGAAPA